MIGTGLLYGISQQFYHYKSVPLEDRRHNILDDLRLLTAEDSDLERVRQMLLKAIQLSQTFDESDAEYQSKLRFALSIFTEVSERMHLKLKAEPNRLTLEPLAKFWSGLMIERMDLARRLSDYAQSFAIANELLQFHLNNIPSNADRLKALEFSKTAVDSTQPFVSSLVLKLPSYSAQAIIDCLLFLGNVHRIDLSIPSSPAHLDNLKKSKEFLNAALMMHLTYMINEVSPHYLEDRHAFQANFEKVVSDYTGASSPTKFEQSSSLDVQRLQLIMESLGEACEQLGQFEEAFQLFTSVYHLLSQQDLSLSSLPTDGKNPLIARLFHVIYGRIPTKTSEEQITLPLEARRIIILSHLEICSFGLGQMRNSLHYSQTIEDLILASNDASLFASEKISENERYSSRQSGNLQFGSLKVLLNHAKTRISNPCSYIESENLKLWFIFYRYYILHVLQSLQTANALVKAKTPATTFSVTPQFRKDLEQFMKITDNQDLYGEFESIVEG